MSELVDYSYASGISRITFNDGKVNVMTYAMLTALDSAFEQARKDKAVVILRSGIEGIFSAGFDTKIIASGGPSDVQKMVKAGAELALKILSFPYPVIGVCNGSCFPMGAFLLLASDIRIGATGTYRIGLNEVAIGIAVPTFALELAKARINPGWLNRSTVLGEMFEPADAVSAGFIDRLVPAEQLDATAEAIAAQVLQIHHPSHAITKNRLRRHTVDAMQLAIDTEQTIEAYEHQAQLRTKTANLLGLSVDQAVGA